MFPAKDIVILTDYEGDGSNNEQKGDGCLYFDTKQGQTIF